MLTWLLEPLQAQFFVNAMLGGLLAVLIGAIAGTWVVIRQMAFFGEALAHGLLPGVALATMFAIPPVVGALTSAAVMALIINAIARRGTHSHDVAVGVTFVGMLALGVMVVSRSRSFATDLTHMLFGDVLAITRPDLWFLLAALLLTGVVAFTLHRSFTLHALDSRLAQLSGANRRINDMAMTALVTLAIIACYQAVGTLLALGLVLAPAAAAAYHSRSVLQNIIGAAAVGAVAVISGLYLSWYAGTAASASIALCGVVLYALAWALHVRASQHTAGSNATHAAQRPPQACDAPPARMIPPGLQGHAPDPAPLADPPLQH